MKTMTSLLNFREPRSRRGNEVDNQRCDPTGIRLLTSAATWTKLALAAVLLSTAVAARGEWVSGHFRSNGTYVSPYYRTPANGIPYDNLSYRGYPSQQPYYVSPRSYNLAPSPSFGYGYSSDCRIPSRPLDIYGSSLRLGDFTFHNYYTSEGGSFSGTTINLGDISFTSLYGN